jgi:hypothetical protein
MIQKSHPEIFAYSNFDYFEPEGEQSEPQTTPNIKISLK